MNEFLPKVAITGATGLVGRALVSNLVLMGQFEVLALTRSSPATPVGGAKYLCFGNLTLQTQWQDKLVDVHILVHKAGTSRTGTKKPLTPSSTVSRQPGA